MPMKPNEREYRSMELVKAEGEEFNVEGYATTFDEPYLLMTIDGVDYFEKIDRHALDNADMSDVIMQYDHSGMVYARTRNNTLQLECDDHGLHISANLGKTADARSLHEAISVGNIDRMSWAFVVDDEEFDRATKTRTIKSVRKVFDVSAVSYPANPDTLIMARSFLDGEIEKEKQELLALEARAKQKQRIKILMMMED